MRRHDRGRGVGRRKSFPRSGLLDLARELRRLRLEHGHHPRCEFTGTTEKIVDFLGEPSECQFLPASADGQPITRRE